MSMIVGIQVLLQFSIPLFINFKPLHILVEGRPLLHGLIDLIPFPGYWRKRNVNAQENQHHGNRRGNQGLHDH